MAFIFCRMFKGKKRYLRFTNEITEHKAGPFANSLARKLSLRHQRILWTPVQCQADLVLNQHWKCHHFCSKHWENLNGNLRRSSKSLMQTTGFQANYILANQMILSHPLHHPIFPVSAMLMQQRKNRYIRCAVVVSSRLFRSLSLVKLLCISEVS